MNSRLLFGMAGGFVCIPFMVAIAQAQVSPDGNLNTTVTQSGLNYTITNGTAAGTNLYHSFGKFSLPTGSSATFDLNATPTIRTIFSRVTGGSVSNIDGLIQTINSSNPVSLFLINPAGIIFGANARLNIGGSFIGTTANSIKFADGTEFSATNATGTPLLTVSIPIGLQMNSNSASITVQGGGHNAQLNSPANFPVTSVVGLNIGTSGLQVPIGNTLALVGGNIAIDGGILSAPGGRIELGSVEEGTVGIQAIAQGFALNYANVTRFGNTQLTQRALASVSGVNGVTAGSVQIQGKQVSIDDGSMVLVQNRGSQTAGDITVNATEMLRIKGGSLDFQSYSSLINETLATGAAGNITLSTPQLILDQGGSVLNRSFSVGASGNIIANVTGDLTLGGAAANDPKRVPSFLFATSHNRGNGGNVLISAQTLSLFKGGATIGSRAYSDGNGGDVDVKADVIRVFGSVPVPVNLPTITRPSLVIASTFGNGRGGNLTIDTRTLLIEDSGRVSTSTVGARGNAGNLSIRASESIEVNGETIPGSPSYIGAAGLFFVQPPAGNGGNITISTPVLNINRGGQVLVQNLGTGNAGTLNIFADLVKLDNGGSLLASTASGEGGDINLQANVLILRHGSNITTTAGGTGNGGNITINAPIIAGFENSDIIANAVKGRGGNIQITTQGIFGLKFRPQLTPANDITASSQFGVNGNVQINNLSVDPTSGIVQLPVNLVDPSQQIATGCNVQGSRFVETGRGGLPPNPTEQVGSDRPWSDIRDVAQWQQASSTPDFQLPTSNAPILEATTLIRTITGDIALIAPPQSGNTEIGKTPVTCATAKQ